MHALVLELVEGLTLADRLEKGRLEVDEAIPMAKQIAMRWKPRTNKGSFIAT